MTGLTGNHRRFGGRATFAAGVIAVLVAACGCGTGGTHFGEYGDALEVGVDYGAHLPAAGETAPRLVAPHVTVTVAGRQIATESREFAQAMRERYPREAYAPAKAADGAELVLVALEIDRARTPSGTNPPDSVKVTVKAGDRVARIDELTAPALVAIATRKGAPITLVVADDGRDQSLDLRTGALGADAAAELQHPVTQSLSGPARSVAGSLTAFGARRSYHVVLTAREADRRVYRPDLHWAKPGRAWLFLSLRYASDSMDTVTFSQPFFVQQSIDLPTTVTLKLPDGTNVPALPGTYRYDPSTLVDVLLNVHFDVPAGTRSGTVSVALGGTVTAVSSVQSTHGKTQQVRYAPTPATVTFEVTLPG